MKKLKKVLGILVLAIVISAFIFNMQINLNQNSNTLAGITLESIVKTAHADDECPGWDGYSAFCGLNEETEQCEVAAKCRMVCIGGC